MKTRHQNVLSYAEKLVSNNGFDRIFFKNTLQLKKVVFSLFLLFVLPFTFSVLPMEYCHAVGTPTYWDSRVYPLGLVDEGSINAGLKGRATEYLYQSTSEWTTQIADLEDGNFMMQVNPNQFTRHPLSGQCHLNV